MYTTFDSYYFHHMLQIFHTVCRDLSMILDSLIVEWASNEASDMSIWSRDTMQSRCKAVNFPKNNSDKYHIVFS